ncbi:MAG: type II toxin-antitoxin system VapC family toxin [Nitrososphaera sp.]
MPQAASASPPPTPESQGAEVAARLREAKLVAPALLPFEIASVCLKKLNCHPEQREALLAAHRLFTRLDINQPEVELPEVVELAHQAGLTAYDASYLWLARCLQAELVTLDGRLARAAAET